MQKVYLHSLGLTDYKTAWELQKKIFKNNFDIKTGKEKGDTSNHLFLLEHPHVYTLGNSGDKNNLLINDENLRKNGISFYQIERGGDITYHGPGQIVGYPLFDLDKLNISIKDFIFNIEEILIKTVAHFGIKAGRITGATGVWVNYENNVKAEKIAAIGMKISKKVSMHGFALNVNTDLSYFNNIIPCGIRDKGVTSIEKETGKKHNIKDVEKIITKEFEKFFDIEFITH